MFTPHCVAGGPGRDQKLNKSRTTSGTFVASGEQFKIVDSYTEPRAAHMMLEHAWTGITEFQEIAKPINNISNHERCITNPSKWADMASEEEFEDDTKEHEKGLPENPRASTHRPL